MTIELRPPHYIETLKPYVPGKPIEETQREFGLKKVIKLASNENPLGPSPLAMAAAKKALTETHRYPDAGGYGLKQALSKNLRVTPENLVLGNGSNDVIDLAIRAFCQPGDAMLTSRAAFIAYRICAQVHGVKTVETELTRDFRFDLPAMLERIRQDEKIRIVFIANPNNPTGTYNTQTEMQEFLKGVSEVRGTRVLIVLDDAYGEYVTAQDLPNALSIARDYPNVMVLKTFSKIYGLAGFRVGYGVGSPEVIATLQLVRQPFNTSLIGQVAAEAALKDTKFVQKAKSLNRAQMKIWEKMLERWSIPFWKSQGNFILADIQKGLGLSGDDFYQRCLARGLILRPVTNYQLPFAIRLTVGTAEENDFAFKVIQKEFFPSQPSATKKLKSGKK